jgi:xanthine dehydrogenase YagS FAD-binding subunit
MGGVAHKPWRLSEAENMLVGKEVTDEVLANAAKAAMKDAKALSHNKFKVELGERAIVRAIRNAIG